MLGIISFSSLNVQLLTSNAGIGSSGLGDAPLLDLPDFGSDDRSDFWTALRTWDSALFAPLWAGLSRGDRARSGVVHFGESPRKGDFRGRGWPGSIFGGTYGAAKIGSHLSMSVSMTAGTVSASSFFWISGLGSISARIFHVSEPFTSNSLAGLRMICAGGAAVLCGLWLLLFLFVVFVVVICVFYFVCVWSFC